MDDTGLKDLGRSAAGVPSGRHVTPRDISSKHELRMAFLVAALSSSDSRINLLRSIIKQSLPQVF